MERALLVALGLGFLAAAVGIGSFLSAIRPSFAPALLLVWPITFAAGFGLWSFVKMPLARTAGGALLIFGIWAVFWVLVVVLPPPPELHLNHMPYWQDMLQGAGANAVFMSGGAFAGLWRLHRAAKVR